MWNWIQGEFYIFLAVMEHYPRVWILPCIFLLFCLGLIAWLNNYLGHYFETRAVTQFTPIMDQYIVSIYDRIRGRIVNRYLLLGTLFIFICGYLKYRRRVY